ncbi:MAG: PaeR7I family type II restriction endonuclease [Gemmatimonadota bacterium]
MQQRSAFPWSEDEIDTRVRQAVRLLWGTRAAQAAKQLASGKIDAGTRGTATGGRHLDAFADMLAELARLAGFGAGEIRFRSGVEVPGFYRPTKKWDLVVIRDDRLCAAVELKSMAGSYGKNLNNRSEEALGSATDVWAAFKQGTLGVHQPWLGYLFVIREEASSGIPVKVPPTPLPTDPVFERSSYVQRYGILCERMVLERLYSAAAYLAAPLGTNGQYTQPRAGLEFSSFAKSFYGHLVGCA